MSDWMSGTRPHRLDEMCWCGVQSASPMDHGGSYSTPPQVVRFDLEASGHDGRAAVRALHGKARELVGPDVEYQFDAVELCPHLIDGAGRVVTVRATGSGWAELYHGDIWPPEGEADATDHHCDARRGGWSLGPRVSNSVVLRDADGCRPECEVRAWVVSRCTCSLRCGGTGCFEGVRRWW